MVIDRICQELDFQFVSRGYDVERRGDKLYVQSGYGPGDDRSAVIIDVGELVRRVRDAD